METGTAACLQAEALIEVMNGLQSKGKKLWSMLEEVCSTECGMKQMPILMNNKRDIHFPDTAIEVVYLVRILAVSNRCSVLAHDGGLNSDYHIIDLSVIPVEYIQRCNY
jgi:hypothetical protein